MKTLCVEGWRFIHQSFAMVNQWQLLALLKRNDIALSIRDLPFFGDQWQRTKGLFANDEEIKLSSIPVIAADTPTDVTYRISFPYDFSPRPSGRTFVFGTAERQYVSDTSFSPPVDVKALSRSDSFFVIAPSNWSRAGYLHRGFREDQVLVIPHGVANGVFRPSEEARKTTRDRMKLSGFVFANASAMTENKGMDVLLRAFAAVAEKNPDVRLLLKGADGLYDSKGLLLRTISTLPPGVKALIGDRLLYDGSTLPTKQMAGFYLAADAYVSPYRSEGFNLPALEASACGVPVIATKGGPTDDFLSKDSALFIDSRIKPADTGGVFLEPSLDHLVQLMLQAMDDEPWRRRASTAGVDNARKFDWDTIADRLIDAVFK
jgi:glycosyltransferase involved in cell wall biosynthesis